MKNKNNGRSKSWVLLATILTTTTALAQTIPDIGFKSVGRGRPLAAVQDQKIVGPAWIGRPAPRATS